MKTLTIFKTVLFVIIACNVHCQYLETFPIPEKGIIMGPCPGGTSASCADTDFTGVEWDINGNFSGFDAVSGAEDYLKTNGSGVLEFGGDIDEELCYESPVLDISAVAGAASFSVDLTWLSQDAADYIDVEYQLDGGVWVQIPNQFGGGSHTIDYGNSGNNGSGTISQTGLVGNTLSIRVCPDTNTSSEITTVDNVSVPEAGAVVLPVKWAEFTARSTSKGNQLNWATYTEVNNERFDIEKSVNGTSDFREIGSVEGAGTSTKTSRYEFLDRDQSSATSYYRIKQVDFDGHFEYSEIVVVQNNLKDKLHFTPNPFSSQLLISSNQQEVVEGTSIRMYNNQGQLVLEKEITNQNLNDPIDTDHLGAGMYSIQYSNGEVVRVVKF